MSAIRHEHRTLPLLIALGVLLGAGLALASPAGRRSQEPSPTAVVSPTASPSASSTPVSSPSADEAVVLSDDGPRSCSPAGPAAGVPSGVGGPGHALRVLAAACGRGQGIANAIAHLQENLGRSHPAQGEHAGGGSHGHQGGQGVGGGGDQGKGKGSARDGSMDGGDTVHGKGKEGEHGQDVGDHGQGGGSSGPSRSVETGPPDGVGGGKPRAGTA